jgi:mRNA-degrading endonuclease RelE of RelBE toxin-antitoxin system
MWARSIEVERGLDRGKSLKGELEGSCGARRGPYRILYNINDAAHRIEILRIDHRADVYRNG